MAKHWRVTPLVALALLGCLLGTEVEAQGYVWQNPATTVSKGAQPQGQYIAPSPQKTQQQQFVQRPPKATTYPATQQFVPTVQKTPQQQQFVQRPPKATTYPATQQFVPTIQKTPQQQQFDQSSGKATTYPATQQFVPTIQKTPQQQQFDQASGKATTYPATQQFVPTIQKTPQAQQFGHSTGHYSQANTQKPPQYSQGYNDQVVQSQEIPQKTSYRPSVEKQPSFKNCDVATNTRVPCGASDISAAGCEAIDCCFDGQQCYFGKAVTVQCTKDAQFIVIVARDATLPHIDLETISLLEQGQGCTHVDSNAEFAIYQFPVTSCGSIVMEEPGVIIYENRMTSLYEVLDGHLGDITRDSHFELLFQCRYIGTAIETVVIEVLPLQEPPLPVAALGPIRVHLRLANGECNAKGCNELDMAYTSFFSDGDYPVRKVLRDPVYVEVQLLEKTDPNLVLTLGRCWTTTSPNPHDMPQWDILIDGCPYRDDRYLSTLVPVDLSSGLQFPTHYRRFIFKMFTFVDPNSMQPMKEHVYIHCSTAVCTAAAGHSCEPSCFRKRRDVSSVTESTETESSDPKVVVSVGPLSIEGIAE